MNKIIHIYKSISLKLKRSFLRFFLSFFLAWIITVILNDLPYFSNLIQQTNIDILLRNLLVLITETILNTFGFTTFSQGKFLQIIGSSGIRFEYSCLGIRHIVLFTIFIICYFGKAKHKLWFVPAGIILLILINAIRAVIISIGQYINENATGIVHDISTPILMYSTILALWIFWINMHTKSD